MENGDVPANQMNFYHESTKFRKYEKGKCKEAKMGHHFDELSGRVIESAITVHKTLGPGFLENIYEEALSIELSNRNIIHTRQQETPIYYDGKLIGEHRLDIFVEQKIVVELKAIKELDDIHFATLRSYLRATNTQIGLLLNFNSPTLTIKRVVN